MGYCELRVQRHELGGNVERVSCVASLSRARCRPFRENCFHPHYGGDLEKSDTMFPSARNRETAARETAILISYEMESVAFFKNTPKLDDSRLIWRSVSFLCARDKII